MLNAIDEQKAAIDRLTKMLGYIDIAKSLAMDGGVCSEIKAWLELEETAETIRASIKDHEENIARFSKKSNAPKTAQGKRNYFVDEAKDDVEFWLSTSVENVPMIKGGYTSYIPNYDKVEFIVNRKNRKVTALIKDEDGHVFAKGIAKCAPDDCFNSHIGRAIALRRALGLGIPLYYLSTP